MKLFIVELVAADRRKRGVKMAVHAETEDQARSMAHARYGKPHWTIASMNERAGPAAITFEESWIE